jgi:ABC-type nitrate/sulfonate/bicarbonate transport system substrate-binding protein
MRVTSRKGCGRRRGLATAVVLGGLFVASAAAGQPPSLTVAVGGPATDAAYLPVHVAAALDTFDAEGIAVTLKRVKHAAGAMTAVRDREAGIAVTTLDEAIRGAWARNFPVQILAAHVRAPSTALLVAPSVRNEVRRVEDLRGRAVAIPGPGTTGHLLLATLLRGARIQPWQVETRSLGTAAMVAALAKGDVAAALVEEPWTTRLLEADRAVVLLDLRAPEVVERVFGGPFYEVVSVVAAPVKVDPKEARKTGAAAKKDAPPPIEPPPAPALAAYARAVARAQVWLATADPGAIAERLPPALVGDRGRFEARLRAQRAAYAGTGEPTPAGIEASLRVLRAGSPWPVTLSVGPAELAPPPAVVEGRQQLGPAPPAP